MIAPDAFLVQSLLESHCLERGNFRLASGRRSPWYVDVSKIAWDAAYLPTIVTAFQTLLGNSLEFEAIGGPALGSNPICVALALARDIRSFTVRKIPREGGSEDPWIVGLLRPGDRVVLLDDVVTTGASLRAAANRLPNTVEVVLMTALLDRNSGLDGIFRPLLREDDLAHP